MLLCYLLLNRHQPHVRERLAAVFWVDHHLHASRLNPHRLWKQAGLSDIFVGLESGDDSRLVRMRKSSTADVNRRAVDILKHHSIRIWAGLLIEPDFTEEDFDRLRCFIEETKVDVPFCSILTPYPGTDLWDQRYREVTTHNWDYFDTRHAVLPIRLPLDQFYRLCFELESSMVTAMRQLAAIAGAHYIRSTQGTRP